MSFSGSQLEFETPTGYSRPQAEFGRMTPLEVTTPKCKVSRTFCGYPMTNVQLRSTIFGNDKVSSPSLAAFTIIGVAALAATITFFVADDYLLPLILYVVLLVSGTGVTAGWYYYEAVTLLNLYFPLGVAVAVRPATFQRREDVHKAIQETSGRRAEVAAAFGIVLFAVGVIRPYAESLKAEHFRSVRGAYGSLMHDVGSTYLDLCFKLNDIPSAKPVAPDLWCAFLSKLNVADAERAPLGPVLDAQADSVKTSPIAAPQVAAALIRLARRADAIELSPSVRESRKVLRFVVSLSNSPSWLKWLPLVGGFALGLGVALKIGRSFVDTYSIRTGNAQASDVIGTPVAAVTVAIEGLQATALSHAGTVPKSEATSSARAALKSRPCRIHPSAASDDNGRRCGGRRCGDRADAVAFIGVSMACNKQARHASTADRT